jgi:uncharacterized protein (DUF1810 family)
VGIEDPFDLQRFVAAQQPVYAEVLAELAGGHKRSHWMWFVFPQLAGLGTSGMSRRYALHSLAEARAYLDHRLLGARLEECTRSVNALRGRSALEVFGAIDELKFRSSMTLFELAAGREGSPYREALARYFAGAQDARTCELLTSASRTSG